jgi:hypothetical protein
VFTYLVIFYNLRLQFLKAAAAVNDLIDLAGAENSSAKLGTIAEMVPGLSQSCADHMPQADPDQPDPRHDMLIDIHMKPFYDFGCGLFGMHEDVIFLEREALAAVRNAVCLAKGNGPRPARILPSLQFLYQSFADLRKLLPGVFEDAQFDAQFWNYSAIINDLKLLRENIASCLSFQTFRNQRWDCISPAVSGIAPAQAM